MEDQEFANRCQFFFDLSDLYFFLALLLMGISAGILVGAQFLKDNPALCSVQQHNQIQGEVNYGSTP
jgi:hypothetical protein